MEAARCQKTSAANLTEDLIFEILVWLPLYSIIRFRCVCKSWNNLLDQKFLNTKHKNPKLLVTKDENHETNVQKSTQLSLMSNKDAIEIVYPFMKSKGCIEIFGSCNGLVCATSYLALYVWNPCTAEYKVIGRVKEYDRWDGYELSKIAYGFGYDSKTRDYKVVLIFTETLDMSPSTYTKIYTLSSGSWNDCESWTPYEVCNGQPGVFINGALHWLADMCMMYMNEYAEPEVILSFDMEEEKYKELLLPAKHKDDSEMKYRRFVDVLRGCLCLLCSVADTEFEVWEMKEYGVWKSWCKLLKIEHQQLMTTGISSCQYIRRAVSLTDGEILLEIRDETGYKWRTDVVRFDLKEEKVYEYMKDVLQMEAYAESRVSVNTGKFVGDEERKSEEQMGVE